MKNKTSIHPPIFGELHLALCAIRFAFCVQLFFKLILVLLLSTALSIAYCQLSTSSWQALYDSSDVYYYKGDYLKAAEFLQLALPLAESEFGKDSAYALTVNDLALCYHELGKYSVANTLYLQALDIYKIQLGENHPSYAATIVNIGMVYKDMGQYIKAEKLYLQSKKIYKTTLGENHPEYALVLNNLATLYSYMGKYIDVETLLLESLKIKKKHLGESHPDYASSINNLALLYNTIGHYSKAEELYLQSLKIIKNLLGDNHPKIIRPLYNLAILYTNMGRYSKAKNLFLKALNIVKTHLGIYHPDYAGILLSQADSYKKMGRYSEAEKLYLEAMEIFKTRLEENTPVYAICLNSLSGLYHTLGRYKEAEQLDLKALKIFKTRLGENHPNYASSLLSLANGYKTTGRYSKAEKLYLEANNIVKNHFGTNHPDYAVSLSNLVSVYEKMGEYRKAEMYYQPLMYKYLYHIHVYFPSMNEKEKGAFYETIKGEFEKFYGFAFSTSKFRTAEKERELLANVYNYRLSTKALLFNATNKVRQRILGSNDSTLIQKYRQWRSDKDYLGKLYTLSIAEVKKQSVSIDSLEAQANLLEKELSKNSQLFAKEFDKKIYDWKDVQAQLKEDEAAVEVIRFRKYGTIVEKISFRDTIYHVQKDGFTEKVYYAVLILTTNELKFVVLENGKELEKKYLNNYKNSIKFKASDKDSYEQYWSKIAEALKGINKVWFSPDGVYNQINLATLQNPESGKFLIEEMDVQLVTNTKDLVDDKNFRGFQNLGGLVPEKTASLYGYINYQNTGMQILPGTKKEVSMIDSLLKLNKRKSKIYQWNAATEDAIKSEQSPTILHIATHGYFLSDNEISGRNIFGIDSIYYVMNPLLKSGLIFSSSSLTSPSTQGRTGKPLSPTGGKGDGKVSPRRDLGGGGKMAGVLTAYEAMNLNLDNTELVVLSACETGLGEVQHGEGVYGLQRALQTAGARSVIMSLWKVNDQTTQELMISFYSKWLQVEDPDAVGGGDKHKAFKQAQLELKEKYKHPYYWGAFVMVGN
ncbi:MAG: DUF3856 domain-containing protein [Cytophagales bacterium]|nr:DUF3856 domain-containing protein [Cytophagales bacterium]